MLFRRLKCGTFLGQGQVVVVDAVAIELVVPGGGFHVLAPVFLPLDVGFVA